MGDNGVMSAQPTADHPDTSPQLCKISLVQFVDWQQPDAVIKRLEHFFAEASAAGADLVAFPEYILGRRITLEAPTVQAFFALAKQHGINAVAGLIEALDGERWCTTALIANRQGELVGRYLKNHPAAGIAPYWWPPVPGHDDEAKGQLGDGFKVWDLDFARIGVIQCYDGYFPESWGCTSYMGAEIVLWINGRAGMVQDAHCIYPAHAYACVVGGNITDGHNTGFAEPMYGRYILNKGDRDEGRLFPRIAEAGDGMVTATIDLTALRTLRKHSRMIHQRRPELYGQLTQDVTVWRNYPEVPWTHPDAEQYVNKAQL